MFVRRASLLVGLLFVTLHSNAFVGRARDESRLFPLGGVFGFWLTLEFRNVGHFWCRCRFPVLSGHDSLDCVTRICGSGCLWLQDKPPQPPPRPSVSYKRLHGEPFAFAPRRVFSVVVDGTCEPTAIMECRACLLMSRGPLWSERLLFAEWLTR